MTDDQILAAVLRALLARLTGVPNGKPAAEPARLTPMAKDAVEASDTQWRTSADLAGRAGYSYSGRWRGTVFRLVRDGYLERQPKTKLLRKAASG